MPGQAVYTREVYSSETLNNGTKTGSVMMATPLSASSVPCIEVCLQPLATNTGDVYVGGSNVLSNGANGGVMLIAPGAGQPVTMTISAQNLSQVYISPTVNGEGVTFLYW